MAIGLSWIVISRSRLPDTVTSATPASDRSSRVTPGSAIRVNSPGERVSEWRASETIGRSASLNFLMIGSSSSCGRSPRIEEIASRMSWVASGSGFPKLNSAMMSPKPSSAVDMIFLTPAIDASASSTGSRISFSTPSGAAPG